ncbi:hypothetical protein GCM10009841_18800 [Microlunatus panaciterrae]
MLLPLCVGLFLLGVIATGVAWRRHNKGRVIQGVALALAPIALFFSGLLRLVWNGAVAVINWAGAVIFSPAVWFGLSLLGLCIVLWVVGGLVSRRGAGGSKAEPGKAVTAGGLQTPKASATRAVAKTGPAKGRQPAPIDEEMAEIEALLKSRGIE